MKKQTIYILLALILVLNLSSCGSGLSKLEMNSLPMAGSPGYFSELNIAEKDFSIPEEMMVYRIVDRNLGQKDMAKVMDRFDVVADIVEDDDEFFAYNDEKKAAIIYDKRTGSINYYNKEVSRLDPIVELYDDDTYQKMAETYLRDNNLLEDGYYFRKVLRHVVGKTGMKEQVCLVEVVFTTDLDGVSYTGVGPKLCVFFGEAGEVAGFYSIINELEPVEAYPLKSMEEAIQDVIDYNAVIYADEMNATGKVTEVEIAYNIDSLRSNQEYVIPNIIMKGETDGGGSFTTRLRAIPDKYIEETELYEKSSTKYDINEAEKATMKKDNKGDDDDE